MNVDPNALGQIFFTTLRKELEQKNRADKDRFEALYQIWLKIFDVLSQQEKLQFTSLFSLIAFIGQRYQLPSQTVFYLHKFRFWYLQHKENPPKEAIPFATKVIEQTLTPIFHTHAPPELKAFVPETWPIQFASIPFKSYEKKVSVYLTKQDAMDQQLIGYLESDPQTTLQIKYDEAAQDEKRLSTILKILSIVQQPVKANLIEVKIDDAGVHYPNSIIVFPDFLLDVSAIAGCFDGQQAHANRFLLKKFIPFTPSLPLMLGNASNYFLDELLLDPETTFRPLFAALFHQYPLVFCQFSDQQIRKLYEQAASHYYRLKQVLQQQLLNEQLDREFAFIEPTFFSETYGLQGRLDVFFGGQKPSIIELKSGKIYQPNRYGLGQQHYIQTILYDLLIRSNYQDEIDPMNYILYSGSEDQPLRFAPRIKAQQWEALAFRNQIILLEQYLANLKATTSSLNNGMQWLEHQLNEAVTYLTGFDRENALNFQKQFTGLSLLGKKYFLAFVGLIAREHQNAKVGTIGFQRVQGQAALWHQTLSEKISQFTIINHLSFDRTEEFGSEQLFHFVKTGKTGEMSNLRTGDIAVLYPENDHDQAILQHQIFKCTIVAMKDEKVTLRLRNKQIKHEIFENWVFWNLEPDVLDSSFNQMYRGLFQWTATNQSQQAITLGLQPPSPPAHEDIQWPQSLSQYQQEILTKAINAKDYFLLWGPPGTGKTSIMLRYLVQYYLEKTDQQILLLAFTNRAVDEMCESLAQIGDEIMEQYFRIGSKFSTASAFQKQLLHAKIKNLHSRAEVKQFIGQHRIVVSTVSSILGNQALFDLKQFDLAIIDEASQILEPQLVGLLPRFKKYLLIGDHRQLPAVITQSESDTLVKDESLAEAGFTNLRQSFFERLFKQCQKNGWEDQYALLQYQGRMHLDLMTFPSQHFYHNKLHILPPQIPKSIVQKQKLQLNPLPDARQSTFFKLLSTQRLLFVNTPAHQHHETFKTNQFEAKAIMHTLQALQAIYEFNARPMPKSQLGIIAPFRAQIALIKKIYFQENGRNIPWTVDTVERYQGSAKDIILLSFCTNDFDRLQAITSFSDEGVDRKLNVALTRAREQIIMFGNAALLSNMPIYQKLINQCVKIDFQSLLMPSNKE